MQLCRYCHPLPDVRKKIFNKLIYSVVSCRFVHFTQRGYATAFPYSRSLTASARLQTVLPKILSKEKLTAWTQTLKYVGSHDTKFPRRIAVYGLDKAADTHSLTTALLDDPLASHGDELHTLKNCIADSHGLVVIAPCESISTNGATHIKSDLSRLAYFDAEILQIPSSHPDLLPLLWSADVRLLIATPLASTVSPDFLSLISHPSTLLIIQYPDNNQDIIRHTLASITGGQPQTLSSIAIHVAYPLKALSTSEAFRLNSSTVDSVETFQRDYLGSGLPPLVRTVHSLLAVPKNTQEEQKSTSIVIGAIEACYESIRFSKEEIFAAQGQINNLKSVVASARQAEELKAGSYDLNVPESVRNSTRKMSTVFQQISWWKLPFMVDDLSYTINNAIEHTWCTDLTSHLNYQAGRLSLLRAQSISQTKDCYSQLPKPFQSALLKNTLEQCSSDLKDIGPESLSYPLTHRIQQLGQVVTRLHRQVHKALLASSCGVLGNFGAAYALWFSQGVSGYDALGFGAFGALVILRLFIRSWDKIQKKWWADWDRAGQGLERDIKTILEKTTEEKVLVVPLKAIEMLQENTYQRATELDAIHKELDEIKVDLTSKNSLPPSAIQS